MDMRARELLGQKLRWLRFIRHWSQEELAQASGLHRTYISAIERATCNVGLDNVEKLALAFGLSVSELFQMEARMPGDKAG
ncbi:MAG TPA: helix-turn-helix transcriptional regulator [Acidiferrobacterales bacterium]|nr:helix-turn-helix transcriptional regulator [Acidiferrobacterales bacterium]